MSGEFLFNAGYTVRRAAGFAPALSLTTPPLRCHIQQLWHCINGHYYYYYYYVFTLGRYVELVQELGRRATNNHRRLQRDHPPVPAVISGFAKKELTNAFSFQNTFTSG